MSQEPVLIRAGELLLDYLRRELVPVVLSSPDMLRLGHPGMEDEFRLGLCLYETEEVRPNGPPAMTRLSPDTHGLPDLPLVLRFMTFANRKAAFGGMRAADELTMLEAVLRAVHGCAGLTMDGRKLRLTLHPLEQREKFSLWQSMNAPLQPAAYLALEPVVVPNTRIRRIPPVREVELSTRSREGRSGEL